MTGLIVALHLHAHEAGDNAVLRSRSFYGVLTVYREKADTTFSYLGDSKADIDIVMGDARLSMEREEAQDFDLLLLDAFSGDAIPLHLLTREAFETYDRHLAPGGVIALLISTWHLDFQPVVRRLASHFGFNAIAIFSPGGKHQNWGSEWMILTRDSDWLEAAPFTHVLTKQVSVEGSRLWTDDYTSLFQLLRK